VKIGYGKVGRSWKLDPTKGTTTGGDADVARALHALALSRPQDEFILIGRNSAENPQDAGYPSNVVNPWTALNPILKEQKLDGDLQRTTKILQDATSDLYDDLDQIIVWAGQHGTSNFPIPSVEDRSVLTKPQVSFVNYASHIYIGINKWRSKDPTNREEIWLCPDPRNYLKARDLMWPQISPVIGQFQFEKVTKHERYGDTSPLWKDCVDDGGVWIAPSRYVYGALEMTALAHPSTTSVEMNWADRQSFGMIVNENRTGTAKDRLGIIRNYVLGEWPNAEMFGTWTDKSKAKLGRPDIRPCPYEFLGQTLQRWRCTLTTPASGSGWATAKPWECFSYGVVCFFHPHYDSQDWILKDASSELRSWLRVDSPDTLRKRVNALDEDKDAWEWIVTEQRKYFEQKYEETQGGLAHVMGRLDS
jgi:hypothetical protein